MNCDFCETYEFMKQYDIQTEKHCAANLKHAYSVALVSEAWTIKRKHSSRSTSYKKNGIGYDLNFCPECGRRLKDERKKS